MRSITVLIMFVMIISLGNVPEVRAIVPKIYESSEEALEYELLELQKEKYRTGTYTVTVRYHEGAQVIEKQIRVTVDGPYTVINNYIAIDANAVTISQELVAKLTDADWIKLADAHAWRTDTSEVLPVYVADKQLVLSQAGSYLIYFGTDEGVTTAVPVTIIAAATVSSADASNKTGITIWYEYNSENTSFDFLGFWADFFTILRIGLITMLILPILLLLWQFFWSTRIEHNLEAIIGTKERK